MALQLIIMETETAARVATNRGHAHPDSSDAIASMSFNPS